MVVRFGVYHFTVLGSHDSHSRVGGADGQGKAFGILDGGRGLLAAYWRPSLLFLGLLPDACCDPRTARHGAATGYLDFHGDDRLCSSRIWLCVPDDEDSGDEEAMVLRGTISGSARKSCCVAAGDDRGDAYRLGMDNWVVRTGCLFNDVEAANVTAVAFGSGPLPRCALASWRTNRWSQNHCRLFCPDCDRRWPRGPGLV